MTQPQRPGISAEKAREILANGKMALQGGRTLYVVSNTLSDLPPIKNEALAGNDFVIHKLCGEISSEFGEAWIFEIGRTAMQATHSWLVGISKDGTDGPIVGRNLRRHFNKNGIDALPLWTHLHYHDEVEPAYYALEAPHGLVERATGESAAPQLPQSQQQPAPTQTAASRQQTARTTVDYELEELPF